MTDERNQRQADATGIAASLREAHTGKPYLGDVAVLDGLIRQMTGRIFERYQLVGVGEITRDAAVQADKEECHQLARILIGQNEGYGAMSGWTDGGLADYIRSRMKEAVHDEDDVSVVAQAVAVFVHGIYRHIGRIEADNEKEVQAALNEDIRSFVWLLVGLESNE